MKKNLIRNLARSSYSRNIIDKERVERVSKQLKKSELKEYIRDLKIIENKRTVTIILSSEENLKEIKKVFLKIYPKRNIIVKIDPDLITGIKIIDYDNEYEFSLQNFLDDSLSFIIQND